jgi:hypothetical protein
VTGDEIGDLFEAVLADCDPSGEWSTDGFGIDSCLIHCTTIEQDCERCPVCGAENPLTKAGLI